VNDKTVLMRHTLPIAPQFYVTAPQPCPYLDGRMERKLFTALQGDNATPLNNTLSKQGFRRSQNVLYRPSCAECSACMSARIKVADYVPTRSQKRIAKRNQHLQRRATSPWATEDQFNLFRKYLDGRHATGGMADMDMFEFAAMVEETPIRSRVIEYTDTTLPEDARKTPVAACLTDILDDGLSMVYSFFEPDMSRNSPGTYLIMDHIALAIDLGLPYVYLGYWVPGSEKMAYKANFKGVEVFTGGQWQAIGDPESYDSALHPLSTDPIAEQVAQITLPGSTPTS